MADSLENPLKPGWTLLPFCKEPGHATSLKRPANAHTRRCVVGLILNPQALVEADSRFSFRFYSFDAKVTYLAINYLHRILNKKSFATVHYDHVIIAAACISLAAKTLGSEIDMRVNDFWELEHAEYSFRAWLGKSMKSITPFAFLASFVSLSDCSIQSTLSDRATEILFQIQHENEEFLVYTPSAIAAAVLLCVAEDLFPHQFPAYRESLYSKLELEFRQAQVKKLHLEMKEALERSRRAKRLINIEDIGTPKKCVYTSLKSMLPPVVYYYGLGHKELRYATSLKRPGDAQACRDVMGLILKVKECCNLDAKVTYLAINYIHRVLNKKSFATVKYDPEIIATACVSLAAKTSGLAVNLMVADPEALNNVEVKLKAWLGSRMKSITPFTFLASFVSLSDCSIQSTLSDRATEILFQVQLENLDFLVYIPSVIAVVALLCATEELFPQKFTAFRESVYFNLGLQQAQVKKLHLEMKEALERSRRANKKCLIEGNIEDIGTPK